MVLSSLPQLFLGVLTLLVILSGCARKELVRRDIETIPWETYLYSSERRGWTNDTIVLPPASVNNFRIFKGIRFFPIYDPREYSSPAISGNTIYIGSTGGYFYAIHLADRKVKWEFEAVGAIESSPTVAEGKVFFGTNKGILYALDTNDGHEVWRFQARTEIISSPVFDEGVVYFNSADDRVYALRAATGEKLWQYNRGYVKKLVIRMFSSLALYGDKIYCSFTDGSIVAIEKSSGRELWSKKTEMEFEEWIIEDKPSAVRFSPAVDGDTVYFINAERSVIAADTESSEEKWRFAAAKASDFVLSENFLFISGYDGRITALRKSSGEIVWRRKIGHGIPVSTIVAGGYLIIASNYEAESLLAASGGSYIDIFGKDNGKKIWSEKIDSTTSASLVAAYNHLFLVTDKGYLRIYKSDLSMKY